MMDSFKPQKPAKKRTRLALVCLNCRKRKIGCDKLKPKCTNCTKLGIPCNYSSIQWINNDLNTSKQKLDQEIDNLNHQLESRESSNKSQLQIEEEKEEESENAITINFYEKYNTLSLKNSSHEDYKPLNPMSIDKKDCYFKFFIVYLILTIESNPDYISEYLKDSWKSKHSNGVSKWVNLIDVNDPRIKKIVYDRSLLFKTSFFPFLTLQDSNDENIEYLKAEIEDVLPNKLIGNSYLEFFFTNIWPLRPFIDESDFKQNLNRIIQYNNGKATLTLSTRSDLAIIAIYLIILRYSNISVQLIDHHELKQHVIPIQAITTAQLCLSFYKIARKTTLEILQALIYLRCYYRDSPEDGDGLTLTQSQNLMGFIIQAGLSMGLNRDPMNYTQMMSNVKVSNLRRRIWFGIVEIDTRSLILSGSLSTFPKKSAIKVDYPIVLSNDIFDKELRDEIVRESELDSVYIEISNLVNDLDKVYLNKLMKLLEKSSNYIEANYQELTPLNGTIVGSRQYLTTVFKNVKFFTKRLIQLTLELQIHSSIMNYFESNSHLNVELYKVHFKQAMECLQKATDLTIGYLLHKFNCFIDPSYNFEILPLVNTALFRIFSVSTTILLRLYHSLDLFKVVEHKVNDVETINQLINSVMNPAIYMMKVYKNYGIKYHSSLKIISSCNYGFVALNSYKFQKMTKIIKFLESDDKIDHITSVNKVGIKAKLQKEKSLKSVYHEWMQLNNDTVININNSNLFTQMDNDYLLEIMEILSGGYKYVPEFLDLVNEGFLDIEYHEAYFDELFKSLQNEEFGDFLSCF